MQTGGLEKENIAYVTVRNYKEDYCLFYNPSHPYPRTFLDMNKMVLEAGLGNTNPWINVVWTSNGYYANNIPIHCEDSLEDNSNSKTDMND